MADNSKILLGLPSLPPDTIDPKLWGEFLTIYRAMQNLLNGVSEFTGIDGPDALEIASMDPAKYLLGANVARHYPITDVNVVRGQLVAIGGAGHVGFATATNGAAIAYGVANANAAAGTRVEVITSGLTTAIGGMTPGTLYYLSPTLGAIQNLRPVAAGQVIQPIGWAVSSGQMLLNISSYYHQL